MTNYTDLKARLSRGLLWSDDGWPVVGTSDDMQAAAAAIEALEAERDKAFRRRDTWKAKAEGYDELAAAVSAKAKEEPASLSRILLKAALIAADKERAALEAEVARLRGELQWHADQPEAHPFMAIRARAALTVSEAQP